MKRSHLTLSCVLAAWWLIGPVFGQQNWQEPPKELREKLGAPAGKLRAAMAVKDERQVLAAMAEIRELLGPWAGVTEVQTKYYAPIRRGPPPSAEQVKTAWKRVFDWLESRYDGKGQWGVAAGQTPSQPVPLRNTAEPVLALWAAYQAGLPDKGTYRKRAGEGLQYLLSVQADNGVFPFPDVRGRDSFFGPMVERMLKRMPQALRNGWFIDDDDGGLQFDNAICGVTMLESHRLTGDKRYLEAARRAADWAAGRPIVTNFNYNAFSVWLLARAYSSAGEKKYLDAAIEKTRIGVIPGQMENGRWMDFHNARPAYHWILVRGMLHLLRALPPDHAYSPVLEKHLLGAIDNGAAEIRNNGAVSVDTALAVLSEVCRALPPKSEWQEALTITANALLDQMGPDPANARAAAPYGFGMYMNFRLNHKDTKGTKATKKRSS